MNLDEIQTKCFILALFIRDDDERFLLGARAYEFKDSQLHFIANTYQNDIVEVQGNDGVMLAGQVRRGSAQIFDGYIGDSSVDRSTIEEYRKDFFKFFRKNHYYKVVYIFPDGTAIQRRNGFIVEAPEVKELYQLFPEYHIAMNFEDINYYTYEEDGEGHEIYGESVNLKVTSSATDGLIWGAGSETILSGEGSNFTLLGTISGNPITDVQLKGDTTQQTYSGKNLLNFNNGTLTIYQNTSNTSATYDDNNITITAIGTTGSQFVQVEFDLDSTKTYTISGVASKIVKGTDGQPYVRVTYVYSDDGSSWSSAVMGFSENNPTEGTEYPFSFQISGHRYYRVRLYNNINSPVTVGEKTSYNNVQIEQGSTATSFEPYVGGIPAPNPDYPQAVNNVTGRQVVEVYDKNLFSTTIEQSGGTTAILPSEAGNIQLELGSTATPYQTHQSYEVNLGKNLFDASNTNTVNGYFDITHLQIESLAYAATIYIPCEPNTTYTIQRNPNGFGRSFCVGYSTTTPQVGTTIYGFVGASSSSGGKLTITTGNDAKYLVARVYHNVQDSLTFPEVLATIQIEKGNQATTYAPYFTPIELCKIGTYQDYIYKSGDDWFVHKAISKTTLNGTENWGLYPAQAQAPRRFGAQDQMWYADNIPLVSNYFIGAQKWSQTDLTIWTQTNYIAITDKNSKWASVSALTTWLSTNNVIVYYVLATATDTQITNADLIAQLNALAGATTYNDKTIFAVNSDNQLGILSLKTTVISLGGVDWDEYGAEWQEGSGGGPTTINIDSIDNVYPVWEITGPAVNPQLSDLTTNTTLTYTGTVTSSQTLKIDMFSKTATLNGVSVVGNVSGDWVYMKPGVNKITYTTGNAEAPDSTLWWQEIVG